MACDLTQGFARICKDSLGGNSKLFLINFVEDPFTIVAGQATAINVAILAVYEYALEGDSNTLVESIVSDVNTGTSVNTQTITAVVKQMSATKGAEFNLLAYNYPVAVVKDRNAVYHAIGIDDGIDFTIEATTGGAKTDLNGYTLTGVSTTGALSPKLDAATITALEALV